jgi:CBS-domain-containing membrane protein
MQSRAVMGTTSQVTQEINHVLRDLVTARDEARVRAHLLGMDARRRLADLDQEIESFERKLSARGEWVAEQVLATARGLTRAIAELMQGRNDAEPTRARDVMTRDVVTCSVSDKLNTAAQRLWEADCGSLPVIGDHGELIGMLTDRDICMAAYTSGKTLSEISVTSAMSRTVHSCQATDTLRTLMDKMATHQIRRLPVLSDEGQLVGIVSLADVARLTQAPSVLSHEARIWVPGVLAGISEPPPPANGKPASAAS